MEHIKAHITKTLNKKEKATERGELMQYFRDKLNSTRVRDGYSALSLARIAKVLQLIPTKDLYYLQSVCNQAPDFSKKFWWEVNPKNHTKEAKEEQKKKFAALDKKPFTKYKKYVKQ